MDALAEEPRTGPPLLRDERYELAWRLAEAFLHVSGVPLAELYAGVTDDAERGLFTNGEVRRGGVWAWLTLPDAYLAMRLRDQLASASGVVHLSLNPVPDLAATTVYLFHNVAQNLRQAHPTFGMAPNRSVGGVAVQMTQVAGGWQVRLPDAPYMLAETLSQALAQTVPTAHAERLELVVEHPEFDVSARWRSCSAAP